jgi:WD40 repeat protein
MKPFRFLFSLLFFLAGCAPVAHPTAGEPQSQLASATPTLMLVQPTPTAVPTAMVTPTPDFPLSLSDTLPVFVPISAENASQLIPVASADTESIADVFLTEAGDKIILLTSFGYQVLDRATFQPETYQPLTGLIFGLAVSPDGSRAVHFVPGNPKLFDLSLKVTDVKSGRTICTYNTEPISPANNSPAPIDFHSDGSITYLTSGSRNQMWRWDANCRATLNEKEAGNVLAISDDGQQAAIGKGNEIFIYSTSGGSRKRLAEVSNPRGVHFLPDGKSILVTFKAGNAIYNLASGEKTHDFPGSMGDYFASYQPSQDGEWILVNAYKQNRALRLSDDTLFTLPGDFIHLSKNPLNHGSNLENGYVITQDYIWDIAKQGKVASLKKYGTWMFDKRLVISADRTRAAVSAMSEPHSIDILDLSNGGKPIFTIPDYYNPIALPDGTGFIATFQGKTAFFDYTSDQPLRVIALHYVEGLVLKNGVLLIWDNLGNIHQLDPANHSLLHSAQLPFVLSEAGPQNLAPAWGQGREYLFGAFLAAFMTPRWSQWAVAHNRQIGLREVERGVVQFFNMRENSQAWQQVAAEDVIQTLTPGDVFEMTFSPDDRLAAGVFEKKLVIWEAATGKELRTIPLPVTPGAIHNFEFSPDGSKLLFSYEKDTRDYSVSIHTNTSLRIFDVQTGRLLKFFDLKQDFRKSGCNIGLPFIISADSAQVITITENCRIGIFDTATWELKQEFHDPFKDANIDLALSPDNRLLAVAYQNKLELWDFAAGKLIKSYSDSALRIYPPHRDAELSYVYQVAFSPDGALIGTRFSGEFGMTNNSIMTLWAVP